MKADDQGHFDEELDVLIGSLWGSETLDKLEILHRRAYYSATTPRDHAFRSDLCPSSEELEWVIEELNNSTDARRSGRLLTIVYYATRDWMLPSLARFLEGPSVALAFETLFIFRDSGAVGAYAEHFIKLMRGQPWDNGGVCQRLAMSCVDEYLYRHSHPAFLRELLNIHESGDYAYHVQQEALSSLGRVVGVNDLPPAEILNSIRERLKSEERQ